MRRDLPDNLYERSGYYSWRNPTTGREFGIGRDRADAIAQAKEANQVLEERARGSLVQRIAEETRTIAAFAPRYREALEARKIATLTRYNRKRVLAHLEHDIGSVVIGPRQEDAANITREISDYLRTIEKSGRLRTAQLYRTVLIDFFSEVAAAGWVAVNPAEVTRVAAAPVKRARLTLDDYQAIYKSAGDLYPWVRRSMEIALVSLQRREDIAEMRFRDVTEGRLMVEQQKSAVDGAPTMRLRIPLELRLHVVTLSLGEIVGRCRGDHVVSRHLIHHDRSQGQALAGDQVHPQTITGAFREARDLAGIKVPEGKTPPTFHELRSLGIRLYKKQGYDPQGLAGHRDPDTTAIYLDNRGAEWVDVAA